MTKLRIILIILFFTSVDIFAQQNIYIAQKSKIGFLSDASLELIKASSNKLQGVIDMEKRTFAFSILTESFKGFNSPLQPHTGMIIPGEFPACIGHASEPKSL